MGWFEITSKNHENDRHIVCRGETFGGTKTTKVYDKATGKTGEGTDRTRIGTRGTISPARTRDSHPRLQRPRG
jgi:hypothetical protein